MSVTSLCLRCRLNELVKLMFPQRFHRRKQQLLKLIQCSEIRLIDMYTSRKHVYIFQRNFFFRKLVGRFYGTPRLPFIEFPTAEIFAPVNVNPPQPRDYCRALDTYTVARYTRIQPYLERLRPNWLVTLKNMSCIRKFLFCLCWTYILAQYCYAYLQVCFYKM